MSMPPISATIASLTPGGRPPRHGVGGTRGEGRDWEFLGEGLASVGVPSFYVRKAPH